MSSSTHNFLRILVLIIMVSVETFLNGSFLAKNNAAGILGGSFDAFSFAFINIGFSVIITIFVIKQIVRPAFIWKIIGLLGIVAWIAIVLIINLALAHFRETSGTFLNGAANDVVQRLMGTATRTRGIKKLGSICCWIALCCNYTGRCYYIF